MALLFETFDGPDSVFASSGAFWDNSDLGVSENPDWFAESGTMNRLSGTGHTTSSVFRMWTRRTDLAFTTVEMDVRFNGWAGGTEGWHGINLWLNRRLRTPADGSRINDGPQQEGYVVDFLNRDGMLYLQKKVGDVYYILKQDAWQPVAGTWYRWGGRVIDNGNGTSTIQVLVDGQVIQQVTDDGSVGGPRLLGGRTGLRSDYSDMTVDNLTITGGSGMTTFARDSCTDADGTLLQNHVPEVGGPWAKEGSGVDLTINTGRIVFDGTTSGTTYYLGGLAATDEFDVEARFVRLGTPPSDGQLSLTFQNDAAASTFYRLRWLESSLSWEWVKTIAGASTVIGWSTAQPLNAANPARTVKIVCRNALKEFFVDGVKIGETTNNEITGFRRVGTRPYRAGTATNGFALDDLLATDPVVADTTPPAVPTGLAATPGNAQVALSWTANTEADLAGHRLYRDGVQIYDGAAATFTDTGAVNGTTYSYTVSAYDTAGNESAKSTAVQATPTAPADTTPPAVPTGLAAAPGDAQVSLDWSANTEGDLAGYRLYRDGVQIFDGAVSTYLDATAVNGTAYSYAVSAYDASGNASAQSAAVQATPVAAGSGLVAPHNRAVLTPRPVAQPPPDTYQAWLGPLRFVTVLGDVTETLGETIEAVGAALVAAERRPRPFRLTLPVRGDRSETDLYAAGLRLRRQVRQLIENAAWRNQPLYFWFGPDPDLQGWLLLGGGDLSYDDGGLVHSDFKLELTDCYLVGRPGQVRPARRLELADHRGGTAPRDTRRTLYSTDRATQALPAQPLIVPGDTVRLTGARRAPLDPLTTPGPTIAARALWRSVPTVHGDVVDYTPDPLRLPDPLTALRDLDPPGRVRAWDVTAGIPTIGSYTPTGDQEPAAGYGWGPVLGKPLRGGAVGAMDNGWCRVMSDLRGGIRIERLDLTAGTYVTVATVLTEETVLDIAAVELTAERAVIAARTPNREIRAVLQRGWDGPRLEVYHDAPTLGAPTLLIVPQANYTLPAQNPAWVHAAHLDTAARLLLAPVQADTTLTQETIDERSAIRLSQPAGSVPGVLVCQVGLALAGDALTAGQVASRAICDARSIPTLVTAA